MQRQNHPVDRLFGASGEMAARMRRLDWSKTALGPSETWPRSLRTAVEVTLGAEFPAAVCWGTGFILLYNDAYRPILGITKHPSALACPTAETFAEIWHIVAPLFEQVVRGGEEVRRENQLYPLERNGYVEECYFTFRYSPIRDDDGAVGGIWVTAVETTGRVVVERRRQILHDLVSGTAAARTPDEACRLAAGTLAQAPADVPFALLYLVDSPGRRAKLTAAVGLRSGESASPASVQAADPRPWPIFEVARSGQAWVLGDLPSRVGALSGGAWPESPHTALVLPIGWSPGEIARGVLVVGVSPRRPLQDTVHEFFELVAGAIGTTLANLEASRAEERLANLRDSITDAFCTLDEEFRFTHANRKVAELAGKPVAEMIGQSLWDVFPGIVESRFHHEQVHSPREPADFEVFHPATTQWFEVHTYPSSDGLSVYFRDVTARRQAEEEMASLYRESQQAVSARDDVLRIVSHDLRNPLNAMTIVANLLGQRSVSDSRRLQYVDTLKRSLEKMSALIRDLLDAARIESGRLTVKPQPQEAAALVAESVESMLPLAAERGIEVRNEVPAGSFVVNADRARVSQVLANLIANAVDFTSPGGRIAIYAAERGDGVCFSVADTGCGIAVEDLEHVFDRYWRGTSGSRSGSGLGLAVAKGIVVAHGGTIWAESGLGQGSTFHFTLPKAPPAEGAGTATGA